MPSPVLLDEAFLTWLNEQDAVTRVEVLAHAALLQAHGPGLGRPYVDAVAGSMHPEMKELRLQIGGEPWRILFAVDAQGAIVLLAGSSKAGDKRWYRTNIRLGDERLQRHLKKQERKRGRG